MIDIINEPKEEVYFSLLENALSYCSLFSLIIRNSEKNNSISMLLQNLNKYLIKKSYESEWPGTKLLFGHKAELFQYDFNLRSYGIIKDVTNRLFGWYEPILPEDLCLYHRDDNEPWLVTISHENDGYFIPRENEIVNLCEKVKGLKKCLDIT